MAPRSRRSDISSPHAGRESTGVALLLLLLPLPACSPPAPPVPEALVPPGSNILLLTVDTLRADHLSAYGYDRQTSPNLDRLAAEGVRFDQATVQWPKTGPSFASLFTATYPKDNDIVRQVGIPLPCRFRMLAEELRERGYSTHAVVANGALAREFLFDQGFDTFIETWKLAAPDGVDPNGAERVTELATAVLDRLDRSRPYFLWVHYLDPYEPPEPWRDRFQDDEHFDASTQLNVFWEKERNQMYGIGASQVLDGREDLAFYVARYDAEIAYTDAQIGLLLTAAAERGLLERTLSVFTSDHGESLAEHHYHFDHGRFSFQTCLHVPLVLHYPGVLEPGVERAPVELLDLAPTLLEIAGAQLEEGVWMQGRSLAPRLVGTTTDDAVAFAEAGWETGDRWQKVVRDRRHKLVFAASATDQRWIGGEGVPFVLYDLEADPGETTNVADREPQRVEELKRLLWRWNEAEPFPVLRDPPSCGDAPGEMSEETRRLLETLGYL
jgi:arylsulfatase A-like enzyme